MTTHRRYYFEHPGTWTIDGAHDQFRTTLGYYCQKHWWFNEARVEGEPFGRLAFSVTVSGGEQWEVHKRAMSLAKECYTAIGLGPENVPVPIWEALEPHTNRGRFRVPTAG